MDSIEINDLLNELLTIWAEMFDVDLEPRILSGWTQIARHRDGEELNESRDLDPTGLTTFMMLRALVESHLKNLNVTGYGFLRHRKEIIKELAPLDKLLERLEDPQVAKLIESFQEKLLDASDFYGIDPTKKGKWSTSIEETTFDLWEMAYLRHSAFKSVAKLETHQFTQGDGDPESLKVNPDIYEFWNINSLLRAMQSQMVPGITLCLIRDPIALHSFFVFAIKNGDTITVVTDRDKTPHPLYKSMSRRPDRSLERRAERNHFPYQLLDLEVSENQQRLYTKARTALVPTDIKAVKMASLKDLSPDQFIWMTMVFDLLCEKFWVDNHQVPKLSYTGEMVIEPHALVGEHGALIQHRKYQPLEVRTLAKEDVAADKLEDNWERKPVGNNEWLINRFVDEVPEAVYNIVGDQNRRALLSQIKEGDLAPRESDLNAFFETERRRAHLSLQSLDPTDFGTEEHLEKDREWTARFNQASATSRLVRREFERTCDEVKGWYRERIEANSEFILKAVAHQELELPIFKARQMFLGFGGGDDIEEERKRSVDRRTTGNCLRQHYDRLGSTYDGGVFWMGCGTAAGDVQLEFDRDDCSDTRCFLNGAKAVFFSMVRPSCPEALAVLCGCEVGDLPEVLQHWYKGDPYMGNAILSRLDPADWVVKNPWTSKMLFGVHVALSKSGFNKLRKQYGLPRLKLETL